MGLKRLLFVFAGLLTFGFSSPAQAEFLSVSADLPIGHSFRNSSINADGTSGFGLQVKFPFLVGVGLEQYDTKLKGSTHHVLTDLYDVFYQLPIPVINITVGVGYGKTQLQCDACTGITTYKDANTSTNFVQLGWPILPLIDLHVGLHNTYGTIESTDVATGTITKSDIGGAVSSLGLSIGF